MNIKFNYLYRDYGNYKTYGFVVFSNPDRVNINVVEVKLAKLLIDSEFFHPSDFKIPFLKHSEFEYDPELDHSWNEFISLEETTDETIDNRTINEFIKVLDCASNDKKETPQFLGASDQ
jgi:hypothetical protein